MALVRIPNPVLIITNQPTPQAELEALIRNHRGTACLYFGDSPLFPDDQDQSHYFPALQGAALASVPPNGWNALRAHPLVHALHNTPITDHEMQSYFDWEKEACVFYNKYFQRRRS